MSQEEEHILFPGVTLHYRGEKTDKVFLNGDPIRVAGHDSLFKELRKK